MSLDNTRIVQHFGITSARVYQFRANYRKYGRAPLLKKRWRKSHIISEQLRQDIIGLKLDSNLRSSSITAYLRSVANKEWILFGSPGSSGGRRDGNKSK